MNDAARGSTRSWLLPGQLLQQKGLVAPDRTRAGIAEVRAATDRIGAFLGEGSVPLKRESDCRCPGRMAGAVPALSPDDAERPPLLVYAHGGGFMQGKHPELGPFPARSGAPERGCRPLGPITSCRPKSNSRSPSRRMVAMTRLAAREGAGLGHRPARLALGGDSAGANLALAAALAMRDAGEEALRFSSSSMAASRPIATVRPGSASARVPGCRRSG